MRVAVWLLVALLTAAAPRAAVCVPRTQNRAQTVERMRSGDPYPARAFAHDVVTIECDDGYRLAADFVRRRRSTAKMPGVLLFHDFGGTRRQWLPVVLHLAGRGCAVLAVDLRGHGESPSQVGSTPGGPESLTPKDVRTMLDDVRNAVSFFAIKSEVDGGNLAFVGAGFGADLALTAAEEPWAEAVRCVVLLSPSAEDRGLKPLDGAAKLGRRRHVYAAAARGDAASFDAATRLIAAHGGPKELFAVDGPAHGLLLFGSGAIQKIPGWVTAALFSSPR